MNTIQLFFTQYDVFSGKFQSTHFVFLEMQGFVEATWLFKFISLCLREIVCLDI